jgi:hypothetical protein
MATEPMLQSNHPLASVRCRAVTKRGEPCPHLAEGAGEWCLAHDPARGDELRARMSELGKASRAKEAERKHRAFESARRSVLRDVRGEVIRAVEKAVNCHCVRCSMGSGCHPLTQAARAAKGT